MRLAFALLLSAILAAALADDAPKPVTPAEAIAQIGQPEAFVEMAVKKAKNRLDKRGLIYLDSEDSPDDKANLGVAISAAAAEAFKKQGVADPAEHFRGKTIRVKGCVMRFEERPYLPVHDPAQIEVVK